MTDATRMKTRSTGARASLGHVGFPHIVSATGGELDIVTGASQPGFNPLDLLYASLSACLAMSARIAAHQMGLLDRIENIVVDVSGEKAKDEPSRIARFSATFIISGRLDDSELHAVTSRAEDICTVSNTLMMIPHIEIKITKT